jgi:hypothetical protein
MIFKLHHASIDELKTLFSTLPAPDATMRHGFFRASFVGPLWIRKLGRPSLAVSGLPGWQGKRFLSADTATNILKKRDAAVQALSMTVVEGISQVDGKSGVALYYGADAPMPWRWVRDELRAVNEHTLLGITVINLPIIRHFGFPFLLKREA